MKTNSIAFRLVAGAALWLALALIVSGFVLAKMFHDHVERGFEHRMTVLVESLIAVTEIADDGSIALRRAPGEPRFEQPYSGWYWKIGGNGATLHSRSLWDQPLADGPAHAPGRVITYETPGPRGQQLLVQARDITLPGATALHRFAVAADMAEIAAEIRPFNVVLGISLGALWVGLMIAVLLQIKFGLRPLDRLRARLVDIRTGRAHRLEGEFAVEVAPLAKELNELLDQITRVVERARTHVGNLAHALKTPLSVMSNEAGDADGPLAEVVRREAETMRRQVDHHLARARTVGTASVIGARTEVSPVVEDLRRTLARIHAGRGIGITVEGIGDALFRGDRQDLEEMVGNIIDNGCKWARASVRIGIARDGEAVRITIEDDGDGLPADKRREALRRGARLDESVPGSGLGLAIVQEIAGLYDGALELGESELGGLRVELTVPAVEEV